MTTDYERNAELRIALEGLLGDYKGSWFATHGGETDFEKLPRVIRARKALAIPPASSGAGGEPDPDECNDVVIPAEMQARADARAIASLAPTPAEPRGCPTVGVVTIPADAAAVLRDAYTGLAFAFNRLHGSARTRDGELCSDLGKIRGRIEAVMRNAGEKI